MPFSQVIIYFFIYFEAPTALNSTHNYGSPDAAAVLVVSVGWDRARRHFTVLLPHNCCVDSVGFPFFLNIDLFHDIVISEMLGGLSSVNHNHQM